MKLVMTLVPDGDAALVDAQICFHLNAGVDFVIADTRESGDGTCDVLESFVRSGFLRLLDERSDLPESDLHTHMARLAATEHDADWLISSGTDEFWWPRAESLKELLLPIPPRYTIVQALVREFVPSAGDGGLLGDRMTLRRTVQPMDGPSDSFESMLRPVFRAHPDLVVGPERIGSVRRVPLRAWYPIEVFRIPRSDAELVGDDELTHGLGSGTLVTDTRLRDALRTLQVDADGSPPSSRFALPEGGASRLALHSPDIVDDAAFAVECAEVGEVDLTILEHHIDDLERRIAWLEERFWPRVLRRFSRMARRPVR